MLKGRLLLIKNKIRPCEILCDIGTDHAFLPIDLIKTGICRKVIATDIRKGPLDVAFANAKKNVVLDRLDLRLGNGLEPIDIDEIDTLVIAGMGGDMIAEILQNDFLKAKKANLLILQPMNSTEELRSFLFYNGFDIFDEELCEDENKLYNIICVRYTGTVIMPQLLNIVVGESLIQKKDPLLILFLQKKLKIHKKILKGLMSGSIRDENAIIRTQKLIEEMECLL